jgi:hypothetical protein
MKTLKPFLGDFKMLLKPIGKTFQSVLSFWACPYLHSVAVASGCALQSPEKKGGFSLPSLMQEK